MQTLQSSPKVERLKIQICRINGAASNYVREALVAGHMLIELRSLCHDGTSSKRTNQHTPDEDLFVTQAEALCARPRRTLYRWMEAAERTANAVWPDRARNPDLLDAGAVEIEGENVLISELLSAPDTESTQSRREFRSQYLDFISGKSLAELIAVLIDGDDAHRITRAHNGRDKGGAGDADRKDYPFFVGKHLLAMNTNLEKWDDLLKERPAQYQEIAAVFRAAICGGKIKASPAGDTKEVAGWPRSLCELLGDLLRERLRKRDGSEA